MAVTETPRIGRREFLVRAGVLGAAIAVGDVTGMLRAPARADGPGPVVAALRPALDELARDTVSGLVAFVVPGPDAYSRAQGVTSRTPGGIAADGVEFMLRSLDDFYPLPDEPLRMFVQAMATAGGPEQLVGPAAQADEALTAVFRNDTTMPLSLPVAMLLNLVATQVNPAAANGPFLSPFSRLSYAEKAECFRVLEEETASVVAMLDDGMSEPMRVTLSGLIKFVAGALLEFAAFGSYSEFGAFDREHRRLTGVPVGWRLSGYLRSTEYRPVEGWDELHGYFQSRRRVTG